MTVPLRGAGSRRGGRRPGWLLLTVLLMLAIVASSALVFTNRIELLKLAVILALWAAVIGAFVSAVYRRQSDVDQARVRDLKLVYDLQLDREISARQEYELAVESKLRQELAFELRTQATDDVMALRAELAALRTNLEILFDTNLADRPALETDRAARPYGDWTADTERIPPVPGRVESSRIMPVSSDDSVSRTAENPIIDVPEEPLVPIPPVVSAADFGGQPQDVSPPGRRRRRDESPEEVDLEAYRGSHRGPGEAGGRRRAGSEFDLERVQPQPQPEAGSDSQWARGVNLPPEAGAQLFAQRASRHATPPPAPEPPPELPRHRGAAEEPEPEPPQGQHAGGQSVADLLQRLQASESARGGRRRRRDE